MKASHPRLYARLCSNLGSIVVHFTSRVRCLDMWASLPVSSLFSQGFSFKNALFEKMESCFGYVLFGPHLMG